MAKSVPGHGSSAARRGGIDGGTAARSVGRGLARPVWPGLASACVLVFVFGGRAGATPPDNALTLNGSTQYVRFGTLPGPADAFDASQYTLEVWFNRTGTGATTSTGTGGVTAAPLIAKGRAARARARTSTRTTSWASTRAGSSSPISRTRRTGGNHPVIGIDGGHEQRVASRGRDLRRHDVAAVPRRQAGREADVVGPFAPRLEQHPARRPRRAALNSTGVAAGFFPGRLDEARIWNVARTGAQIRANKNSEIAEPATGLIGRWGLDEGSGTTVADSSGSGINGTLVERPGLRSPATRFPQDTTRAGGAAEPGGTAGRHAGQPDLERERRAGPRRLQRLPLDSAPVPTSGHAAERRRSRAAARRSPTRPRRTARTYYYVVVAVDGSEQPLRPSNEDNRDPERGAPATGLRRRRRHRRLQADAGQRRPRRWSTAIPGAAVFTIGDNAYPIGAASEFANCYDPTWGAFKNRTRPRLGNHDFGNGARRARPRTSTTSTGSETRPGRPATAASATTATTSATTPNRGTSSSSTASASRRPATGCPEAARPARRRSSG